MSWNRVRLVTRSDGDLESLDIESSLQKRTPSAKDRISIAAGFRHLQKHNSGYSSSVPSSKPQTLPMLFFQIWEQNHSIHGRNPPLTKFNLKKTSPFLRNVYKEKKIIFHDWEKISCWLVDKGLWPKGLIRPKEKPSYWNSLGNVSIFRVWVRINLHFSRRNNFCKLIISLCFKIEFGANLAKKHGTTNFLNP